MNKVAYIALIAAFVFGAQPQNEKRKLSLGNHKSKVMLCVDGRKLQQVGTWSEIIKRQFLTTLDV